ncbi:MarR family winged helix-turn-helix transcriptional regulator [Lentzea sp. NPDC006480]|uniref:MarR family winged helix-turn-helix transcriptional regulator n=1 Tax=Lentzea sp. NPDC006480 TaxID=3157176 RepID=UPI0033B83CCF
MTRFSGPDDSPGFLLWRVTLAWQRAMRAALAPHDLTHVQFVLLASLWWLVGHSGPPSQQRLAEQAGTDPMMTSQVLRKLADRALISREVDPADSRARLLDLTAEGKALVAKAMKDVEDADAAYFAGLGDEQQAFVRGLTRLL